MNEDRQSLDGGQRLKMLMLIKAMGRGGAEMVVMNFGRYHDRNMVDLHCGFLVMVDEGFVADLRRFGVTVHHLGRPPMGRVLWPLRLWQLLGQSYDAVHMHSALLASVARIAARLHRRPRPVLVSTEHVPWSGYRPVVAMLNRWTGPSDDVIFSASPATTSSLPPRLRQKARTTVQGIALEDFSASDAGSVGATRQGLPVGRDPNSASGILFGALANFRFEKGYPVLLDAFARVVRLHPGCRLAVAGAGTEGAEFSALIAERGLADRVDTLGACEDAAGFLKAIDVLVVASLFEAGPLVVMEAAAVGRPIVTTDVGVVRTHFTNEVDALVVEPNDAEALAAAMCRLVVEADLRAALATTAHLRSGRFSAESAIESTFDTIAEQVMARDSSPGRGRGATDDGS